MKKKNRGFTLIEITAVVLILGVIFLVSYPTLENILNKSEKDQLSIDEENIILAAKTYINKHSSEYDFTVGSKLSVQITSLVEDELIDSSDNINVNSVVCEIASDNTLICKLQNLPTYENGTVIYYNPETNNVCSKEESEANVNENGTSTGIKTGCMKWYAFNDEETSNINMILDHNTTSSVKWNSNDDNTEMLEVKEALDADTSSWNAKIKSTARLIKANEIATITGNKEFNVSTTTSSEYFYFDTNTTSRNESINTTGASKYAWLFDNLETCISYGCNVEDNNSYIDYDLTTTTTTRGYWTSSEVIDTSDSIWVIHWTGKLSSSFAGGNDSRGVRPVITVDKAIIS